MKLGLRSFLFLIILMGSYCVRAQNNQAPVLDEKKILFRKEYTVGALITNRGFGVNFKYSKQTSGLRKITFNSELAVIKHPQEVRQVNPLSASNPKSFAYGKKNNLILLRLGVGSDQLLFDKDEKDGVEIQFIYDAGISLGLIKPIYYDVQDPLNSEFVVTIEEKFDPIRQPDPSFIYGTSGFLRGLGETSLIPGLYAKAGLNFDFSREEERIKSIEIGLTLDGFSKKTPIMAVFNNIDINKQTFLCLYLKASLGRKY